MKRVVLCTLLLSFVFMASLALAEPVPSTINYQSYLTDETGAPLTDGNYEISFSLYDQPTSGAVLWSETWTGEDSISTKNGRFSVSLGAITSFDSAGLDFSKQYYLEIRLGSDTPFSPRLAFNSVPYAMHAQSAGGIPMPAGAVVGTTDAQTLTNKTLTGAVIEGGTMDGTVIGATHAASGNFTDVTVTGNLTVQGTITARTPINTEAITADYTISRTESIILVDTSAGPVTVTLPNAAGSSGQTHTIKLIKAGNPLSVIPAGAETVNGQSSMQMSMQGQAVRLVSDGSCWLTMGEVGSVTIGNLPVNDQDLDEKENRTDFYLANDLVVSGSECVGMDCKPAIDFDFDTLVLKENNLRIKFDDTSSAASFPNHDWEIAVNDTADGGRNYFAINDVTEGKTGLIIEAGGNVGIGSGDVPRGKLDVQVPSRVGTGTVSINKVTGSGTVSALLTGVSGKISTTGTQVTGTSTDFESALSPGMKIIAGDEIKTVVSVQGAESMTVDSPWSNDITDEDLQFISRYLTGAGTSFLSEISTGAEITIGGSVRTVVAIDDDNNLTLDQPWETNIKDEAFTVPGDILTGQNTNFKMGLATGSTIYCNGEARTVAEVESPTQLKVDRPFSEVFSEKYYSVGSANRPGLVLTSGGDLGIGTATPDEKFEIEFTSDIDVEIGRGTKNPNVTFIALRSPNGTKYYVTVDDDGKLSASTIKP